VPNAAEVSEFRSELIDANLLFATEVDGVYHRSPDFETIVRAVSDLVHRSGTDQAATEMYFSPVTSRVGFEQTGYLRSFPDLVGSIHSFTGRDTEHAELMRQVDSGADWTEDLVPTEVVLVPAACHPLYPGLAGMLTAGGQRFEVEATCFRREPSIDPTRMQSFRMREFVYIGEAASAIDFRDMWLDRAATIFGRVRLDTETVVANDPFFGRAGRLLSANQRAAELKYEIVTPIMSTAKPTAIASGNYHQQHFGHRFTIFASDGEPAYSACFGFGLERITLALLRTHGLDRQSWPPAVIAELWP